MWESGSEESAHKHDTKQTVTYYNAHTHTHTYTHTHTHVHIHTHTQTYINRDAIKK